MSTEPVLSQSKHLPHVHPEWGVEQVGWIGQSGAVYTLDDPPYDSREPGSFSPLYQPRDEECGHATAEAAAQVVSETGSSYRPDCTCPHDIRPLGVLDRINMGKGKVRLSTTTGCPVHDTCGSCGAKQWGCYTKRWAKGFAKMAAPCCAECTHLHPVVGSTAVHAEPEASDTTEAGS